MLKREIKYGCYINKKLFHLLIDCGIFTSELTEMAGFSTNILIRLHRNQRASLDSIKKFVLHLIVVWMIFWNL